MKLPCILTILAGIVPAGVGLTGPAAAQGLIAPTRNYTVPAPSYSDGAPSSLDKNYGLPTFGMPGSELPQQRTLAPARPVPEKPDVFKSAPDLSSRDDQLPETPDFFQASPGLASANSNGSSTPDFFKETPDTGLPKTAASGETPLFTTSQTPSTSPAPDSASTTGDTTTGDSTLDSTTSDGAADK